MGRVEAKNMFEIDKEQAKKLGIWIDNFLVKVSDDDMLLYIEKEDPLDRILEAKVLKDWDKIKKELKKQGFFGILPTPEILPDKIILAKGLLPMEGIPEKIVILEKFLSFLDKTEVLKSKDEKEIFEKEDLRELHKKIICVDKDEAIAKRIPPVPGIPGINIWGDTIEPPPTPSQIPFSLGKFVYLDEKDNLIKAKEPGVVIIEKDSINVYPEYTLDGDIDYSTGNVYFKGKKLKITGDIKFGFKVICEGDLELIGSTENKVYIEVKGNFQCFGIIRGENTVVKINGNAEIRGVEYSTLEINGDLIIYDYMIFSKAIIMGNLKVISGRGLIYGGKIKVAKDAEVNKLGNENSIPTYIAVGYNPVILNEFYRINKEIDETNQVLKKLAYGIMLGENLKKEKKLSQKAIEILNLIYKQYNLRRKYLENLKVTFKDTQKRLEELKTHTLTVFKKVYPEVSIYITTKELKVNKELTGLIIFYLDREANKIKIRT